MPNVLATGDDDGIVKVRKKFQLQFLFLISHFLTFLSLLAYMINRDPRNIITKNKLIQLWDTRTLPSTSTSPSASSSTSSSKRAIRTYTHHNDYISDFLYLANKKHLVSTSADGTLSVIDIRAGSKLIHPAAAAAKSTTSKSNKKKKNKKGGSATANQNQNQGTAQGNANRTNDNNADDGVGEGELNPKGEPIARSEDQEDELLSIIGIRG